MSGTVILRLDEALPQALDLHRRGALAEAASLYRKILCGWPDQPDALHLLGLTACQGGNHRDGSQWIGRAVRINAEAAIYHGNLGLACQALGRFAAAATHLRQAMALAPDNTDFHSNLIVGMDYDPAVDTAALQAECRAWWQRHGRPLAAARPPHANPRQPERRLRVGYVSAEFCRHPSADVLIPLLRHHDRQAVEVVCYSGGPVQDEVTAQFHSLADAWCDTSALPDEALAHRIAADAIDILVNLPGHGRGHRLRVFAAKPAPVQISAWGLPRGTGLPTIDAVLLDPVMAPPAERALFAEQVEDLPCWLAYGPPADAPAVGPLPLQRAGVATLGSLNRYEKLSDGTLAVWAELLRRLPGTRLLLKSSHFADPVVQREAVGRCAALGIAPDRLQVAGVVAESRGDHMAWYNAVDIALDPFPHCGGISTLDSLWMGVPVVTLRGRAPAGRGSAAILQVLGLDRWVAEDAGDYLRIVATALSRPDRMAELRAGLRRRLQASPIVDAAAYTRRVEAIYRRLWRRWATGSE
jgi:predicted O-linked N-acetylglucosamine transferase (SPINDLY family)